MLNETFPVIFKHREWSTKNLQCVFVPKLKVAGNYLIHYSTKINFQKRKIFTSYWKINHKTVVVILSRNYLLFWRRFSEPIFREIGWVLKKGDEATQDRAEADAQLNLLFFSPTFRGCYCSRGMLPCTTIMMPKTTVRSKISKKKNSFLSKGFWAFKCQKVKFTHYLCHF